MAKCKIKNMEDISILTKKLEYLFGEDNVKADVEEQHTFVVKINKVLNPAEIKLIENELPDYNIKFESSENSTTLKIPIDNFSTHIHLSRTVDDLLKFEEGIFYNSLIAFKRIQLRKLNEEKDNLYKELKMFNVSNERKKEIKRRIRKVVEEIEDIENFMSDLKEIIGDLKNSKGLTEEEQDKKIYSLLQGILLEEIESLENKLNDLEAEVTHFKEYEDAIKFYYAVLKGLTIDGVKVDTKFKEGLSEEALNKLSTKIEKIHLNYLNKLEEIRDNIIKNEETFKELGEIYGDWKIDELVKKSKDINWLEKTFLGIGVASTDENIIPQTIKRILEKAVVEEEAQIKVFKDRLRSLIEKFDKRGINEEELLLEKTKFGNHTGNIIHYLSLEGRKLFSELFKKVESGYISKKENAKLRAFAKENFDFIDIRKIKKVKELYGNEEDFKKYFIFSEKEMKEYEDRMRKRYGKIFDEMLNEAIEKIEQYKDQYQLSEKSEKVLKANNPFEVIEFLEDDNKYYKSDIKIRTNFVHLIPKYEKEGYLTEYYNKEFFEKILPDDDLFEYWKIMSEVYSKYVNPVYSNNKGYNLSYAKFERQWLEEFKESKHFYGTKLFKKALSSYKSLFFETGYAKSKSSDVLKNYSDNTYKEIQELKIILLGYKEEKLKELSNKYNLKFENFDDTDLVARTLATEIVLEKYSKNLNQITFAILDKAALQRAREKVYPTISILYDAYKKQMKDYDEKTNSVQKLKQWIDRVIKGELEKYRGSTSFFGRSIHDTWVGTLLDKFSELPIIRLITKTPLTKYYNSREKELLKLIHDKENLNMFNLNGKIYMRKNNTYEIMYEEHDEEMGASRTMIENITEEQFEEAYQKFVESKIENLGLDLTVAGLIQGILKTIIIKGLAFNPISGIFNRIEGMNSGLIMDSTGYYWTKGNYIKANSFLAFANLINFSPEKLNTFYRNKREELKKLQILNEYWGVIQDRKNELERQAEKSGFKYVAKLNPYVFAVDAPEFKNQNSILLSILADIKVKDKEGNEHSVFDLEKGEFTIYELKNNKLVLKEQFRTEENIASWEEFRAVDSEGKETSYFKARMKIKSAISRSQGNYDNLDVIYATKPIYGRALTLFLKWMPEHVMQRFASGKNFNLSTGKRDLKGRYRTLIERPAAIVPYGIISSILGFGLSPITGFASLGFMGYVIYKYLKTVYSKENIVQEAFTITEMTNFLKSFLLETLNYPMHLLNINKKLNNNSFEKMVASNVITEEDANNLVAMTKELAIRLTWISILIIGKALTWDDDDDDKKMLANFLDNRINRIIETLAIWNNPAYFLKDMKNLAFIRYMEKTSKLMQDIVTLNSDRIVKDALYLSPVPTIVSKGTLPWHDEIEWNKGQWFDTFVMDMKTDGEYSAKKEYTKLRSELKEKFIKKYKGKYPEKSFNKLYPPKKPYETYKEALKRIKTIDINPKKVDENKILDTDKIKYREVRKELFKQFARKYKGDKKNIFKDFRKAYPTKKRNETYKQAYNRLKNHLVEK